MDYVPCMNKSYALIFVSLDLAPVAALLEGTGIDEEALQELEFLEVSKAVKLVENLNCISDNPVIAALYGQHLGVATHGPVGYASISAPTFGKALETFFEWFKIRCQTYLPRISEQDKYMVLTVVDSTGNALFERFFFGAFMRAFEVMIRLLLGQPPGKRIQLHFKDHGGAYRDEMRQEYDSSLYFGAEENSLWIPKELWWQASPLSDPDSHSLNMAKCAELLAQQSQNQRIDLRVQALVRGMFDSALSTGDSRAPTTTRISKKVHMSERTLLRKLAECDISFRNILESERRKFAEQHLMDGRHSIADLANILGYQESANFCRAFKRWTGKSPTAFRRSRNDGRGNESAFPK